LLDCGEDINETSLAKWIRQRWKGRADDANALIWAIMYPYRLILKDTIYHMIKIVAGSDAPTIIDQLKASRGDLAYFFQTLINSSGESQAASDVSDPSPSSGADDDTTRGDQVNTSEKGSDSKFPSSEVIRAAVESAMYENQDKDITPQMIRAKLPADVRLVVEKDKSSKKRFSSTATEIYLSISAKRGQSSDDQDAEADPRSPAKKTRTQEELSNARVAPKARRSGNNVSGDTSVSRVSPVFGGKGISNDVTPAADTVVRGNESGAAEDQSDHGEEDRSSPPTVGTRGAASAEAGRAESRSSRQVARQEYDPPSPQERPDYRRSPVDYDGESPHNKANASKDITEIDERQGEEVINEENDMAEAEAPYAPVLADSDEDDDRAYAAVRPADANADPLLSESEQGDPLSASEQIQTSVLKGKEDAKKIHPGNQENKAYELYERISREDFPLFSEAVHSMHQLTEFMKANFIKPVLDAKISVEDQQRCLRCIVRATTMGTLSGLEVEYTILDGLKIKKPS
jgi:hypothetical protein